MKTHEINELQLLVNTVSEKAHLLAGAAYTQGYRHAWTDAGGLGTDEAAGGLGTEEAVNTQRGRREDELLRAVVALQLALRHDAADATPAAERSDATPAHDAAERSDATPTHDAADAGASC